MAGTLEELAPRRREVEALMAAKVAEQVKHRRNVAIAMSEVKSDPRWKVYADHLEGLKKDREATVESLRGRLETRFLSSNEYGEVMVALAEAKAEARAYKTAVDLIVSLIDRGGIEENAE